MKFKQTLIGLTAVLWVWVVAWQSTKTVKTNIKKSIDHIVINDDQICSEEDNEALYQMCYRLKFIELRNESILFDWIKCHIWYKTIVKEGKIKYILIIEIPNLDKNIYKKDNIFETLNEEFNKEKNYSSTLGIAYNKALKIKNELDKISKEECQK